MAINKYMQAALRALSNVDVDIKANYKIIRQLERAVRKPRIKFIYNTFDYSVKNNGHNIPVRIYTPDNRKINKADIVKYPIIVFFHGGGWVTGSLDSYEKPCLMVAKQTGHIVAAVEYRLAPEHPFPAALYDCYHAASEAMLWQKELNSPHKFTLMGDSAGGNLAAAVSLYMRDKGEKTADRQILIYPATYNNHTESSPFLSISENKTGYILTAKNICDYMDLYCSREEDRNNPYCAPLLADDHTNQPDTLIITAQHDPLRDEGEEYGKKLKEAGNFVTVQRIDDALHGFFSLPIQFGAVRKSFNIINQFLNRG